MVETQILRQCVDLLWISSGIFPFPFPILIPPSFVAKIYLSKKKKKP